jgi:hypothetical protein
MFWFLQMKNRMRPLIAEEQRHRPKQAADSGID